MFLLNPSFTIEEEPISYKELSVTTSVIVPWVPEDSPIKDSPTTKSWIEDTLRYP